MSLPKSLRSAILPPLCAILIAHTSVHSANWSLPKCVLTGGINCINRMGDDTFLRWNRRLNMLEIGVLYLYSKHFVGDPPRSKIGRYLLRRTRIVYRWSPLIGGNFLRSIVHFTVPQLDSRQIFLHSFVRLQRSQGQLSP